MYGVQPVAVSVRCRRPNPTDMPKATKAEPKKVEAAAEAAEPTKRRRAKKVKRQVRRGRAYVHASYNNTIVTLTDQAGGVLAQSSAGRLGFKGPKKATPYAATVVARDAAEKAKQYDLQEVDVFLKGVGSGREAAVRGLFSVGIGVLTIHDVTPIPHNGCRQPRPRRV